MNSNNIIRTIKSPYRIDREILISMAKDKSSILFEVFYVACVLDMDAEYEDKTKYFAFRNRFYDGFTKESRDLYDFQEWVCTNMFI